MDLVLSSNQPHLQTEFKVSLGYREILYQKIAEKYHDILMISIFNVLLCVQSVYVYVFRGVYICVCVGQRSMFGLSQSLFTLFLR